MINYVHNYKANLRYLTKSKYIFLKTTLDFLVALILLIVCGPLLLIISLMVYMKFGKPIFFTQERPGYKNKIFKIFKFRTMHNIKDSKGNLIADNLRSDNFGNWLRSTSIDELPEIINVIKGDMSFVGPRPLLVDYINYYNNQEIKRHNTKPGITGLAQINGRNSISWEEKFKYDIFYIENLSFFLDLKILFITIFKVLKKRNINRNDSISMPRFKR
jgi:lipopolysaccharide/colanic/teichoic acid biosynthesis glycosyltransferase